MESDEQVVLDAWRFPCVSFSIAFLPTWFESESFQLPQLLNFLPPSLSSLWYTASLIHVKRTLCSKIQRESAYLLLIATFCRMTHARTPSPDLWRIFGRNISRNFRNLSESALAIAWGISHGLAPRCMLGGLLASLYLLPSCGPRYIKYGFHAPILLEFFGAGPHSFDRELKGQKRVSPSLKFL